MATSFLKLNDSKNGVLLFGTRQKLENIRDLPLCIGKDIIYPNESVRNIGAMFASTLSNEATFFIYM